MNTRLGKWIYWGKRLLTNPGEIRYVAWRLGNRLRQRFIAAQSGEEHPVRMERYAEWIAGQALELDPIAGDYQSFRNTDQPAFVCIFRYQEGEDERLARSVQSLSGQAGSNWELCVACELDKDVDRLRTDPALQIVGDRLLIAHWVEIKAWLAQCKAGWVLLAAAGDRLAPGAFIQIAAYLEQQPETDLVYCDEDRIDDEGRHSQPCLKPDWSPEFLLSCNYIGRAAFYRKDRLINAGGIAALSPQNCDYELALRFTETTQRIGHIAQILYSRCAKDFPTAEVEHAALERAVDRRGLNARVSRLSSKPGLFTLCWKISDHPLVSIIMLTRDRPDFLRKSLSSIFEKTRKARFEVILVDNGSRQKETLSIIEAWRQKEPDRFRCYQQDIPFNYSVLNNWAAERASGQFLVFLNNDTEIISPDWLEQLAGQAAQPGVAAVGPLLLFPDQTVQHAGIVLDAREAALHAHKGLPVSNPGYLGRLAVPSNFSAISAACMMIRKDLFLAQHGFDPRFAVAFGDVELCLRLLQAGYRHVIMPQVRLYHFESATRGYEDSPEKLRRLAKEREEIFRLWPGLRPGLRPNSFERDPYFDGRLVFKDQEVYLRASEQQMVKLT